MSSQTRAKSRMLLCGEQLESREMLSCTPASNNSFVFDDTAYFTLRSESRLERFDLSTGDWLAPIELRDNPDAALATADGIYVAYGSELFEYDHQGANEEFVLATEVEAGDIGSRIISIHVDGDLLFVNESNVWVDRETTVEDPGILRSFDRADPSAQIDFMLMGDISEFNPAGNHFLGWQGPFLSNEITNGHGFPTSTAYEDNGMFTAGAGIPAELSFLNSDYFNDIFRSYDAWFNDNRVITSCGDVLEGPQLDFRGNLGGFVHSVAFVDGSPITLQGNTVTAYFDPDVLTGDLVVRGSAETPGIASVFTHERRVRHLYANDDSVFAFAYDADSNRGVVFDSVSLTDLNVGTDVETIWTLENREFLGENLAHAADVQLDPVEDATTEWIVMTDDVGTILQNRASGEYLGRSDADPYDVAMSLDAGTPQHWTVVNNADGSIALQNVESGLYLDGDADGGVDSSIDILEDDGWFVTETKILPCDLAPPSGCDISDLDALYSGTHGAPTPLTNTLINQWLSAATDATNSLKPNPSTVFETGDANLDGAVDSTDLGLLLNNFGDNGSGSGWGGGDLNGDDAVDSLDLGLQLNKFGFVSPVPSDPVAAFFAQLDEDEDD